MFFFVPLCLYFHNKDSLPATFNKDQIFKKNNVIIEDFVNLIKENNDESFGELTFDSKGNAYRICKLPLKEMKVHEDLFERYMKGI